MKRLVLVAMLVATRAQGQDVDMSLRDRVDSSTFASLHAVISSAEAANLPTSPLVDKALEGVAKHASGDRIVAVVQDLAAQLAHARTVLGPAATADELTAGTAALRAGIQVGTIVDLRRARHGAPVTIPLAVAAELVARGMSPDSAASTILRLAAAGRGDADMAAVPRSLGSPYLASSAPQGGALGAAVPTTNQGPTNLTAGHTSEPSGPPPKPKPQRP